MAGVWGEGGAAEGPQGGAGGCAVCQQADLRAGWRAPCRELRGPQGPRGLPSLPQEPGCAQLCSSWEPEVGVNPMRRGAH